MKIFKLSQTLNPLSQIDTRTQKGRIDAGKIILNQLGGLKENDTLEPIPGIQGSMSGIDNKYTVLSINPDFTVNLMAEVTQRQMPNTQLFGYDKRNNIVPRWKKLT
jgi:hypothetical protein